MKKPKEAIYDLWHIAEALADDRNYKTCYISKIPGDVTSRVHISEAIKDVWHQAHKLNKQGM